jgi:hypothetical protein
VGRPKGAQYHKVMNDAVKLYLATRHNKKNGKIVFVDKVTQAQFTNQSWRALALRELGIKTDFEKISSRLRKELKMARKNQGEGMKQKLE